MKAYWTDKLANGEPLQSGQFCRVIQYADDEHPIYVKGNSIDEVIEKIERTMAEGQKVIARQRTAPAQPAAPVAERKRLTDDQRARYTVDLGNPARSGAALAALLADETGVDPVEQAKQIFGATANAWIAANPEFYDHPGNRRILGREAITRAGGNPARVTAEILTQCFNDLTSAGELFEAPEQTHNPEPHSSLPAETQVQRTERPLRRSVTGFVKRGGGGSAPTRTLKYTEAEYFGLSNAARRDLLVSNDPDYLAAANRYEGQEQRAS